MASSYSFADYVAIGGTNVFIGKGANAATGATGCTIIGQAAATSLSTASYNTIIGNGADAAGGYATVIGNRARSLATAAQSKTIVIGADAKISATHTNVCVLGGQTNNSSIVDYGVGHYYYMPFPTYTASATVTAADVVGGIILFNSTSSLTCTFPTQTQIFAAMKDPIVGSGFRLLLCKNGTNGLSMSMGGIPQFLAFSSAVYANDAMYLHYVVDDAVTPTFRIRASYCTCN